MDNRIRWMRDRIDDLECDIAIYRETIKGLKNNKKDYKLLTTKITIAEAEIEDLENKIENIILYSYCYKEVEDESM